MVVTASTSFASVLRRVLRAATSMTRLVHGERASEVVLDRSIQFGVTTSPPATEDHHGVSARPYGGGGGKVVWWFKQNKGTKSGYKFLSHHRGYGMNNKSYDTDRTIHILTRRFSAGNQYDTSSQ